MEGGLNSAISPSFFFWGYYVIAQEWIMFQGEQVSLQNNIFRCLPLWMPFYNKRLVKLKGHYVAFKRKKIKLSSNIYNIIEVIIPKQIYAFFHNWLNQLFWEDNKVPRTRKVAGSAKCKYVLSFKPFVYSVHSVMRTKRVYLFGLFRHKQISQWKSLFSDYHKK